jgi:hypothetical protein
MLSDKGYAIQGGVKNFLGETEEVTAPKFWQSSENSPPTELSYITDAEKNLLLQANLHGSLVNNQPNIGASGILSFDGWGDASDGFGNSGETSSDSGFSGGNNNNNNNYSVQDDMTDYATNVGKEAAVGGGFVGDNNNDGGNNYVVPDPVLPPGVISQNFDYETEAYSTGPNDIDAGYGLGSIESSFYNPETKQVTITQTPGIITTEQYQTANLEAYLDSNAVSKQDKIDTLNQLQALSNSNLKGSKLSDLETDFVVDNLDLAFNNVKNQTKYSEFTSSIDEDASTFAGDLSDNPLGTVAKSGGILGTMIRGVTDTYKNNKALELLGYTGQTIRYNPNDPNDFKYSGNYLTGNVSGGEREAMNQLTPLAANVVGNTTPVNSMVNNYFANLGNQGSASAVQTAYDQAKANLNMILTPTNQQFGYSAAFPGGFTMDNLSNNPYNIDYMKNRGLI